MQRPKYKPITTIDVRKVPQLSVLDREELTALKAVSAVLPFRVNNYIVEQLIDWKKIPEDPIYQLTFPQRNMLSKRNFGTMFDLIEQKASASTIRETARKIQMSLNPHPAGQIELNVPRLNGSPLRGMQHKYRETVLFFPSQGQTCHAYCTYCFRWPQFVGIDELKFAAKEASLLADYVKSHTEVSDVLFTGGDPLIMKASRLRHYIQPLLKIDHLINIRIGTKALAYWPYRFTTDEDAGELLKLFEDVEKSGKKLALMAHMSHPRELEPIPAIKAIRRIRATGSIIRSQAPLIRHVNDHAHVWADLWRAQIRLGIIPYYMFVERDTGPKNYFDVPLAKAFSIYQRAYRKVSGLARTVRGPSMSAMPGKVVVEGITTLQNEKVFVLSMLQARNPEWVKRPFFAKYDKQASWLTDLVPAFDDKTFFFTDEMERFKKSGRSPAWSEDSDQRIPAHPTIFGHVEWE